MNNGLAVCKRFSDDSPLFVWTKYQIEYNNQIANILNKLTDDEKKITIYDNYIPLTYSIIIQEIRFCQEVIS